MPKRSLAKTSWLIGAAFVVGIGLVLGGGAFWLQAMVKPASPAVIPKADQIVTTDTLEPAETDPSAADRAAYTVPHNQPRSITLTSIGVRGLVQKVGLTPEGNIAVPTNIFFAGWYTGSSLPGQAGLSIIDGHVSGKSGGGIFKRLAEVAREDAIEVEFGDRTTKRFRVVEVIKVPRAEAAKVLFATRTTILAQLNLITCAGSYDQAKKTFTQRVIVVTRLDNDENS